MDRVKEKSVVLFLMAVLLILFTKNVYAEGEWNREVSVGFTQSTGNTEKAELNVAGELKRVMADAEFLANANIYYSSANDKMDGQKWSSLVRYAWDFGDEKRWFNLYQGKVEHDRFADVDYRLLPATGIGYWFSKEDDWKALAEGSLGYEITNYKSNKPDDKEAVAIGRTYLEKRILENARISEDFSVIPSLEENGTRMRSETAFTNPLKEGLDLTVKYIIDYDSEPASGIKKTDTRFITALTYSF